MNKLLKRSALEVATFTSFAGTFACVLLHCTTNISPITGIWFPIYILIVFIAALYITFKFIQCLLLLNKPLKYDFEKFGGDYPYLSFLSQMCPRLPRIEESIEGFGNREYDTNELSVISTVLERKLVSSWYVPYISQEIGFPFACKQMLDQMIGKTFQICNKIETKDVFVDSCTIVSCHLREYRKAQLRYEKTPTTPIETLYKKSHPIFDPNNKKLQPADHCTNIIRIILKELVPWELWDTPHSELLVRILSKKLDNFIDSTLTDPAWLNDKLLTLLDAKKKNVGTEEKKTDNQSIFPKESVPEPKADISIVEPPVPTVTKSSPILQKKFNDDVKEENSVETIENIVEEVPVTSSEPVDIKSSPILRQRRGRQGRNEVKIYDRIIEGSVKTWETDIDLQCISLGQDLLASLDGEITLSRLWGQDADTEGSPNPPRSKSPQPLWFGEEETIEVDPIDTSPQREMKKEHSPKPAELLKDLQSTVSQAKKQIGDLQVEGLVLDVSRKPSSDEAAGMMEGLLDFGIAGLKKGLRFTGLSDDSQEKSPSHQRDKSVEKSPPPEFARGKPIPEHRDITVTNTHRDVSENAVPPLIKQQRVVSQDSVPSQPKPIPKADALVPLPDSPEPEYEEAADLSTSIAKLRCLLEQRAETNSSGGAEDVWWESAEETIGRTQHHHSSRPVDTATLADEYDMNLERNSSPSQTSNNMQRLDKLFHRTVTGMFNSIKTAVGAEDEPVRTCHDWAYVATSMEHSVCVGVARLLGSRRGFAHVDAALDSLAHLPSPRAARAPSPDDFDEWCVSRGPCCSALGAVAGAAGLARSHVAHRLTTVLVGDLVETLIELYLEVFTSWLRSQVFVIFAHMSDRESSSAPHKVQLPAVDVDETSRAIIDKIPSLGSFVFGEDTLKDSVKLVVTSFSHKEVNKDVALRLLDLLAGHFKKSAGLRNRSFDNN